MCNFYYKANKLFYNFAKIVIACDALIISYVASYLIYILFNTMHTTIFYKWKVKKRVYKI